MEVIIIDKPCLVVFLSVRMAGKTRSYIADIIELVFFHSDRNVHSRSMQLLCVHEAGMRKELGTFLVNVAETSFAIAALKTRSLLLFLF